MNERTQWKKEGLKIVFTNGVFDILHVGHVTYLEQAKALGDVLVVGINDDASVRRLSKGPERPINPEGARMKVISSLKSVDEVLLFHDDTPLNLILQLQPDILVKGGDYDPTETDADKKTYMVGSEEIKKWGGKAVVIDLVEGYSTTLLVKKMKA
jgi:D-beta-D-heptose 7-phosphate kinase/D-beta-D-heptose 1-phosphate adenosyltransferase